ncbi:hypothetical protein J5N97_017520 [Dioscorea zingiberensis]|uniref:Pentatricopeptide repeat-containing protein n=1 Tax=Dioscorea zingiberensis TaxID=325984 RepID=A0A9D5HGG2_9LILI|nr:hypothetical protein J5N97_017520 [Dioscorea zingiberensis]
MRWRQHESVLRLWNEISENGLSPDRSAYIVLIHGLFLNGKLEEASKYYDEMREKGFAPEPKTEEMIQAWLSGKETSKKSGMVELNDKRVAKDSLKKDRVANASNGSPLCTSPRSIVSLMLSYTGFGACAAWC